MGIDAVHGRITTEKTGYTPIGDDEPLSLFRAQDKYMAPVLMFYRMLLEHDKEAVPEFMQAIDQQTRRVEEWQTANGCRTPGLSFKKENHERGGSETRVPATELGDDTP